MVSSRSVVGALVIGLSLVACGPGPQESSASGIPIQAVVTGSAPLASTKGRGVPGAGGVTGDVARAWAKICETRIAKTGAPYVPGADNCRTMAVEGQTRRYIVYVPRTATTKATPVVYMFHGSGLTGEQAHATSNWREIAERDGFIAIFPSGLIYLEPEGTRRPRWNDYSLPCEISPKPANWPVGQVFPANDEAFVDAIHADVTARLTVDPKRVFASGFSNGGAFAKQLAITHTTMFAAVGVWASGVAECVKDGVVVRPVVAPHLQNPPAKAIPVAWGLGAADPHELDPYNKAMVAKGQAPVKNVPITLEFINSPEGDRLFRLKTQLEAFGLKYEPATAVDIKDWAGIGWKAGPTPGYNSVGWSTPMPGNTAGNKAYFALLNNVGHNYPNATADPSAPRAQVRAKDSNGVNASQVFWQFFQKNPK